MARSTFSEDSLLHEIVDQLNEIEADLSLSKHGAEISTDPAIQKLIQYLQVAHFVFGYQKMKNMLRPFGYHIHRLGLDGRDAVVTGYTGVIDTSKGRIIF
nr:MAG TPA: hypothetical protein [Caudoviricetes sp.]